MYDVRQMANLDQLRRLAAVLPPNFRVAASETADLLSAALAAGEHPELIEASETGGSQAVADYYHGHITDNRPEGADEPQKGQPVATQLPPGPVAQPVGPSQAQFDELNTKFDKLLSVLAGQSGSDPSSARAGTTEAPDAAQAPGATVADRSAAESQQQLADAPDAGKTDTGAGS